MEPAILLPIIAVQSLVNVEYGGWAPTTCARPTKSCRGVRFFAEPYRYPWGLAAVLLDQDGGPSPPPGGGLGRAVGGRSTVLERRITCMVGT
jgi:hypothetical protein